MSDFGEDKDMLSPIEHNNQKYYLIQEAYICDNGRQYTAVAENEEGDQVRVYWGVYDCFISDSCDDESNACDWDKFTVVE